MPSAVIPDHQPHSIPLHLLYWRRQRHSTKAQPLSLKAFQVSKPEIQNRAMFLRLVSSVSWYFVYTITQTNDHWTFGAARWGHYTVHKHRAPIIQWCGAISQVGKDVKFAAAKARNLACVQECFYLTITQAITDMPETASRVNVQFLNSSNLNNVLGEQHRRQHWSAFTSWIIRGSSERTVKLLVSNTLKCWVHSL